MELGYTGAGGMGRVFFFNAEGSISFSQCSKFEGRFNDVSLIGKEKVVYLILWGVLEKLSVPISLHELHKLLAPHLKVRIGMTWYRCQ